MYFLAKTFFGRGTSTVLNGYLLLRILERDFLLLIDYVPRIYLYLYKSDG